MSQLPSNSGSDFVWILILGIIVVLAIAATLVLGKTASLSSGIEPEQVQTYTNTIDRANALKNKLNDPSSCPLGNCEPPSN